MYNIGRCLFACDSLFNIGTYLNTGYKITWRFGQIFLPKSTGKAELLAELVGRFGQAFSTDSAIILGRTVHGTLHMFEVATVIIF